MLLLHIFPYRVYNKNKFELVEVNSGFIFYDDTCAEDGTSGNLFVFKCEIKDKYKFIIQDQDGKHIYDTGILNSIPQAITKINKFLKKHGLIMSSEKSEDTGYLL